MNKLVKDALILTVITLVAGLCLGGVYVITKEPIAKAQAAAIEAANASLFPDATFEINEDFDAEVVMEIVDEAVVAGGVSEYEPGAFTVTGCTNVYDTSQNLIGYIINVTTKKGYGGTIDLAVGINTDGVVEGYMITEINETPGLGMKAKEEPFFSQFMQIPTETYYTVTKATAGDGEIEAISGATITSRAVTHSVDAAIAYFNTFLAGGEAQ